MSKLFGPSLFLTLWALGLPVWQAALIPLGALAILAWVRGRATEG